MPENKEKEVPLLVLSLQHIAQREACFQPDRTGSRVPRASPLGPGNQRDPHPESRYNSDMSPDAQRLLDEARQLPPAERNWLIDSLIGEEGATSDEAFAEWQKEAGEPEPGYDEWFRKGVQEALTDTSPGVPHEQVEREIGNFLRRAREAKRLKESA